MRTKVPGSVRDLTREPTVAPCCSERNTRRTMPEEPAKPDPNGVIRSMTDAFNRRDVDGVMASYSQCPVWDTSAVGLGVHEGRDAVRAFHEDWQRAYEDFEGVVTSLEDLGNGVVVTVFYNRARPAGGTGFVELRFALVMTWSDGLVEQVTAYTDIAEARAAAERLAEERG